MIFTVKFIDIVKRELAMHGRNRRRISQQKVELLETYDFQPLFRTFANGSLTTTDTGLGTSACPHIPIYRYKPSVDLLASTIFPATIAAAPGLEVRPVPHPADFSLFFLRRFLRCLSANLYCCVSRRFFCSTCFMFSFDVAYSTHISY